MSIHRDLLNAFEQANLGKFQEALEVFQADPNHFVKSRDKTIFEIILSTPESSAFIRLCVENGADFYMKNNEQFPLHCVIESRCPENLKQVENILHDLNIDSEEPHRRYSSYVNVMRDHGQNSLHLLAEALTNENCDTIFEMIEILINHGCNANYPNYDGKTAFFIVLEKLPQLKARKEILDYFLKYADVDFYTHRSDEIVEMVMNQKLKFQLPEKEEVEIDYGSMQRLLEDIKVNKFETLFPLFKASCSDTEVYADCCAKFMEMAVERSYINVVVLLIDFGIDINRVAKTSKCKFPPVFLAAENSDPGIFQLFLLQPKIKLLYDSEGLRKTLLHQFFDGFKKKTYAAFRRQESRDMTRTQKKCFDLLMQHPKCNRHLINAHDETGLPAIYYAVRFKNDYVTIQLLKYGAYVGTVVNGMRESLVEEFLNSTITTNDRFNDEDDFEIRINYSFLSPPCPCKDYMVIKKRGKKQNPAKVQETSIPVDFLAKSSDYVKILSCTSHDQYGEEMKPLIKIAESAELHKFLVHPTIASFILLKWNKLSFLVYVNLILIVMFMMTFVPFIVLCQVTPHDERTGFLFIFFQVLSFVSLSTLIVREAAQAMLSLRNYFTSLSNWIDISLMVSSLVILFFESQVPNHTSRLLRTCIILLAATEYFNLLGMIPIMSVSIHTKMFKRVCNTFMKSLAFYSMMILAFAFSFYTLQGDKFVKDMMKPRDNSTNDIPVTNDTRNDRFNNFYTVGSSIIKSFVMLTGELDASSVHTEGITYAILFLLFLFLVTIVLYNLLNALAISDTQEIKRDAKLIDLYQRIIAMNESEEAIFQRTSRMGNWLKEVISIFPKTLPEGNITVKPNRSYRIYVKQNNTIILNHWLHSRLKFLKPDVKFNADIMSEIQALLVTRREEQTVSAIRKLKESRTEKLANDVLKMSELISDIQQNVTMLRSDVYNLSRKANL